MTRNKIIGIRLSDEELRKVKDSVRYYYIINKLTKPNVTELFKYLVLLVVYPKAEEHFKNNPDNVESIK